MKSNSKQYNLALSTARLRHHSAHHFNKTLHTQKVRYPAKFIYNSRVYLILLTPAKLLGITQPLHNSISTPHFALIEMTWFKDKWDALRGNMLLRYRIIGVFTMLVIIFIIAVIIWYFCPYQGGGEQNVDPI